MLSDWEQHPIPPGKLPDMSLRHSPELRFRPNTVNVRRNGDGVVVIVKISGNRLLGRGDLPHPGTVDRWEWDRDRDPAEQWIDDLISTVADR
ncbi:hypothetical protein [Mycolicibacterium aubagnense]|uniref:Uncharacterized protein n=1 Tax=Mycolicibacterium aubagnense TaxID=319707 RepID=A0ABN5Z4P2_9MYCO|nr:hypothetical protein [Mycolicibacterium aubagnense]TLH48580.1 hypothetical protein C1S80_29820 [Mycolicibacterium aubagnense]BBX87986.1 hypothetical protein MAUB_58590 [Mycolicibacterium aubagnense]